jgi:hypothetical protein
MIAELHETQPRVTGFGLLEDGIIMDYYFLERDKSTRW